MRAVTLDRFGGPEVMNWVEVADPPPPPPDHVVVRVAATGVNRADLIQRAGHYPPPPGSSDLLGLECSGTVEAVGGGVAGYAIGSAVCALLAGGGYAELVTVPVGQLMPIPDGVSLIDAAALPEVACTVWSNVVDAGRLRQDEVLLIHGGSSGVGTMAIQVAVQVIGARVAVTAGSVTKLEACRALGADIAINYRDEDFVTVLKRATAGRSADVILDMVGGNYLSRNLAALALDGRIVTIGFSGGRSGELDLGVLMARRGSIHCSGLRARPLAQKAAIVASTTAALWPALSEGRIRPVIDRVLPMSAAEEAHRAVAAGDVIGKVLLTPE